MVAEVEAEVASTAGGNDHVPIPCERDGSCRLAVVVAERQLDGQQHLVDVANGADREVKAVVPDASLGRDLDLGAGQVVEPPRAVGRERPGGGHVQQLPRAGPTDERAQTVGILQAEVGTAAGDQPAETHVPDRHLGSEDTPHPDRRGEHVQLGGDGVPGPKDLAVRAQDGQLLALCRDVLTGLGPERPDRPVRSDLDEVAATGEPAFSGRLRQRGRGGRGGVEHGSVPNVLAGCRGGAQARARCACRTR